MSTISRKTAEQSHTDAARLPAKDASDRMSRRELFLHQLKARMGRLSRWEFWPSWLVYAPLVPWLAFYAMRSRHPLAATTINPALPLMDIVGESKSAILGLFPPEFVLRYALIPPGPLPHRLDALNDFLRLEPAPFPVILKPDAGERGTGVRLIRDADAAAAYLAQHAAPVLVQRYHPGPHEIGLFFVRLPDEPTGRIFSINEKRFPVVLGDGKSTLAELIWRHPRLRLQARVFLARLGPAAHNIPGKDHPTRLAVAGNHCRGTMFLDAPHLATPELTAAINRICSFHPGVCFGRFDIRFADHAELAQGKGINIVEFNGLLAESTNIYDPSFSFLRGQRVLREQWRLAYKGGPQNIRRGTRPPPLADVLRAIRAHSRRPGASADSD